MSLTAGQQALCNANSAATGGLVATSVLHPIDLVAKRLQSGKADSAISCVRGILKEHGPAGFFQGLKAKLGWSIFGKFMYYGSYNFQQNMYESYTGEKMGLAANLLCGYLSDFTHIPVTLPFEVISTRMQTTSGKTFTEVAADIYQKFGVLGFYKGFSTFFYLCLQPAITNTAFTQLKNLVLSRKPTLNGKPATLTAFESFLLGAFARCVAVCSLFPYMRAKVLLQTKKKQLAAGDRKTPSAKQTQTPLDLIKQIFQEDGFFALYKGLGPELLRGVLSSAITLMLKERLYGMNKKLILSLNSPAPAPVTAPAAAAAPGAKA